MGGLQLLFIRGWSHAGNTLIHVLREITEKYKDNLVAGVVDTDINFALSRAFEVHAVPEIFIIENQAVVESLKGLVLPRAIEDRIVDHLDKLSDKS